MKYRVGALALLSVPLAISAGAASQSMPPVKVSAHNQVPACVTPGRLMSFIKSRNDKLDPRFAKIAVDYMRHGETLGIRWDFAFVQMAIETGYLSFTREGSRRGDVAARQNNFAGLGATGNGEAGESFGDVSTGVLAHLQHVLIYAGERVDNAVAERTRKVQQWGVLKSWQKHVKGPFTWAHVAKRWATDEAYAEAIDSHAKRFFAEFCNKSDPEPGLVAEARKGRAPAATAAVPADAPTTPGADLARKALADAKGDRTVRRSGLGAGLIAKSVDPTAVSAPDAGDAAATIAPSAATAATAGGAPKVKPKAAPAAPVAQPVAIPKLTAPPAAPAVASPAVPPGSECRVWTASYGGSRAIIIRSMTGKTINLTVLDVNEGQERREADAYISAYAKGGMLLEEFASQAVALDKAFELCPEG
ncbi:MAG TPA: glucosaminidase domain-containing protein [Hyphomicrobiaceae bacterium]|nr:glucosaminidase domain-containing protein [Hyphomicrobiaceae bacterium]